MYSVGVLGEIPEDIPGAASKEIFVRFSETPPKEYLKDFLKKSLKIILNENQMMFLNESLDNFSKEWSSFWRTFI